MRADLFPPTPRTFDHGASSGPTTSRCGSAPPQVIWIRRGNCSTEAIQRLLRESHAAFMAFEQDKAVALLTLG